MDLVKMTGKPKLTHDTPDLGNLVIQKCHLKINVVLPAINALLYIGFEVDRDNTFLEVT